MSLNAEDFIQNVTIEHADKLKKFGDGNLDFFLDYTVQANFHNEPIFAVNQEDIKAYLNYKVYDVYTGHKINDVPKHVEGAVDSSSNSSSSSSTNSQNQIYLLEEEGKQYMSGKTYYSGYISEAKPKYQNNNNNQ